MKKLDKNDLDFLGVENQIRIVKALMEDKMFFLSNIGKLNQNMFTADLNGLKLNIVVGAMKDFFQSKNYIPSYVDLEMMLRKKAYSSEDLEMSMAFVQEIKSDKYLEGMSFAKESAEDFFGKMAYIHAGNKIFSTIDTKSFELTTAVYNTIEELQKIVKKNDEQGKSPYDMMDELFTDELLEKVPVGIEELDEQLNGGFDKKAVALLLAGTGVGKSTLAAIFSAQAAIKKDKKVLHIHFEEKDVDIAKKYYSNIFGLEVKTIGKKENKDIILKRLAESPELKRRFVENLVILEMPNGTTQVDDIRNIINSRINTQGWKPDMVVIDYFSCLQKSSDKRNDYSVEHIAGEKCMKKIEQLAKDLNIFILVCEQTNREATKTDSPSARIGTIQGSFRVVQPASYIFYLARKEYDEGVDQNRATLYLDKNRSGERAAWKDIYLNNGTCSLDLSDAKAIDDNMWENNCCCYE